MWASAVCSVPCGIQACARLNAYSLPPQQFNVPVSHALFHLPCLPAAIPGLLPDEVVAPVADSVGIRLLQKMGWRQGKGIGAPACLL